MPESIAAEVWHTVCPVPAASSLAIARGDFEDAFRDSGVRLQNVRSHADRAVREAHYDQTQSNLFREGGNIPPIWARSLGRNLRVIGLSWIDHYSAVAALPESNIVRTEDLRGKRLGLIRRPNDKIDYTRATALHAYQAALATVGLGLDDLRLIDIPITEPLVAETPEAGALSRSLFSARLQKRRQGPEVRALLTGYVDAIHLSAQGAEIQALLDARVIVDVANLPDRRRRVNNSTPIAFTVRGELLESRPDIVVRYLAQALRTARWAKQHQADAKRYIARDGSIAEEWVDIAYSPRVAAALEPSLDPELVGLLEIQKDFLLQNGFIPDDFDIAKFVAHEPLVEARRVVDAGG